MNILAVLYPGGPSAKGTPELVGSAENALDLRDMVKARGHELVALTDPSAELDANLEDANVIISTPFSPANITK